MGCGFLEAVYQECVGIEFELMNIPHVAHPQLELSYKRRNLKSKYIPDFICYEMIVLELKALSSLTDDHRAQLHNYLKTTRLRLGLLVNFGHYPNLEIERIVR